MPHAKFKAVVEFDYHDEMDYCGTLREIVERGRELASFEIEGNVLRTNEGGERI